MTSIETAVKYYEDGVSTLGDLMADAVNALATESVGHVVLAMPAEHVPEILWWLDTVKRARELDRAEKSLKPTIVGSAPVAIAATQTANVHDDAPIIPENTVTMATPETPMTLKDQLASDATDAAWRLAASQTVKLTRAPLVALLTRHLGPDDESLRGKLAAFFDTELGTAMLAALLGVGLGAMPGTPVVPVETRDRLARELRVRALATGSDLLADALMGPLRDAMTEALRGVPLPAVEPAALPDGLRVVAGGAAEVADPARKVGT